MNIAPDKLRHLKWGSAFALGIGATLMISRYVSPGVAIIVAGIVMGWAVERYQAVRHEGTPDKADWIATAMPAALLGFGVEVVRWLFW